MMTISNGNVACPAAICAATSYCGLSPVPVSPMTANFSESGALGSASSSALAAEQRSTNTRRAGKEDPGKGTTMLHVSPIRDWTALCTTSTMLFAWYPE